MANPIIADPPPILQSLLRLHHRSLSIYAPFRWMLLIGTAFLILACLFATGDATLPPPSREASLPAGAIKRTPQDDAWPPVASAGWSQPMPLPAPINTAGGEDSPFLTIDGAELFFFFTPDVNLPPNQTLGDGVSGIWVSKRGQDGGWSQPNRVVLASPSEAHLDGCPFILGEKMYFCTARAGNYQTIDFFQADRIDGSWKNWRNAGAYWANTLQVGELHITADGRELYFASKRLGGYGGFDLWMSTWDGKMWATPANLGPAVNDVSDQNRPHVTPDLKELWFDRDSKLGHPGPAVFRCMRQPDGTWGECAEMISNFSGEPTLSADGNTMLFVHMFVSKDIQQRWESDIYISTRLSVS
jgi:hypothetical protein